MRARLKVQGRISKLVGDLHLLSGSFATAMSTLVQAVDETRSSNDYLWSAAAQESLQVAIVGNNEVIMAEQALLQKDQSAAAASQATATLWIALPDKLREVAALYQKTHLPLLAFNTFHMIANILDFGQSPGDAAMALCQGWAVHRSLPFGDKLYALALIIGTFSSLHMGRKRAFFLRILSSMLSANGEDGVALQMLTKTFATHHISQRQPAPRSGPQGSGAGRYQAGFPSLQLSILRRAAALAEGHPNRKLMIEYNCALLAYGASGSLLDSEEQVAISKMLKGRQRREKNALDISSASSVKTTCILPIISRVSFGCSSECEGSPSCASMWSRRSARQVTMLPSHSDTFIYKPFSTSSPSPPHSPFGGRGRDAPEEEGTSDKDDAPPERAISLGESVTISVSLTNPYSFPLDLIGLCLSPGGSVPISADTLAVTLPAWTASRRVSLTCTPKEAGRLFFKGLDVVIFGVSMVIPFSDTAALGALDEPQPREWEASFLVASPTIFVIDCKPILRISDSPALGRSDLSLFSGQRCQYSVLLKSCVAIPITMLSITITHKWSAASPRNEKQGSEQSRLRDDPYPHENIEAILFGSTTDPLVLHEELPPLPIEGPCDICIPFDITAAPGW